MTMHASMVERVASRFAFTDDLIDRARMRAYSALERGGIHKMLQAIEQRYRASHGPKQESIIDFLREETSEFADRYSKEDLLALKALQRRLQKAEKMAFVRQAEQYAHHYFDGKNYYVDTGFLNAVERVMPGMELKHMGFGEFQLVGRDGKVDFDRMRGREFPGQSGRSHQVYDDQDGKLVEKMIQAMEHHGKSELIQKQARANPDEACPSRDGAPGDPHVYEKGKCVFCGQRKMQARVAGVGLKQTGTDYSKAMSDLGKAAKWLLKEFKANPSEPDDGQREAAVEQATEVVRFVQKIKDDALLMDVYTAHL